MNRPHECDESCRCCHRCYIERGDPGACTRTCPHAAEHWPDEDDDA